MAVVLGDLRGIEAGQALTATFDSAEFDIEVAQRVCGAIAAGAVDFVYEPVCSVDGGEVLYYECLSRLRNEVGEKCYPGAFVPSLERLGMIHLLDRHVVMKAFQMLQDNRAICLGINISPQSISDQTWWRTLLTVLRDECDIASRFIFELTETTALPNRGSIDFVNRLRETGCGIAIDDLGAGYAADHASQIESANIMKIDYSVLNAAKWSRGGFEHLKKMVYDAKQCAKYVVVEGVDCDNALNLAKEADADWVQGHYFETLTSIGINLKN